MMIELDEKMIIQQGKYGKLKFVKYAYENDEITFETYDGINMSAIYYDATKDVDRLVTLDNFTESSIKMVRDLFVK